VLFTIQKNYKGTGSTSLRFQLSALFLTLVSQLILTFCEKRSTEKIFYLSGLCKRLIDAFNVCLNNMDMDATGDIYFADGKINFLVIFEITLYFTVFILFLFFYHD